ncbi:urea ABC transporter ATP-binding subunit UrtE [Microbacterium yannicii]|uniref:Urea ABC transporter ATP-binding subunit UrtE n=1 Tax=Microbacterium yannicii TaxID=671622 RepID=A0ABP9M9L6_9MICO|nr:ATP-binding cassette domain-containing protein [Microbacterium yannicii]MCO5952403.1 ATP-binding cassette domain-containing protein [Microbacterium yannicii]
MESELVVQNLTVRYGAVVAAEGVSFTVKPGECVVLLGANGAGKTSTLHGIGGLTPSVGTVRLGDVELGHLSASRRARAGLGHVLEGRHVFPDMTVAENLDVARPRSGAKPPVRPLELLPELKEHLNRAAGRLSGGQQQMLAIARAVAGAPQAIMLDEPTNGLAPKLVARTTEIIATLRDLGYAVLVVEQRLEVAQNLAADVLVLRHGHIVHEVNGTDPELPDLLHAAYLS